MKILFAKHAKSFTSMASEKTKGVHFDERGNVWLTDSHKLLCFKNYAEPGAYRVETLAGRKIELDKINFNRLIPESTHSIKGIDLKEIEKALAAAIALSKLNKGEVPCIQLIEASGILVMNFNDPLLGVKMTWEVGTCDLVDYQQHFNPTLLMACVKVVKDAKENFTFEVVPSSPLRPSYFNTDSLMALLLPMRSY